MGRSFDIAKGKERGRRVPTGRGNRGKDVDQRPRCAELRLQVNFVLVLALIMLVSFLYWPFNPQEEVESVHPMTLEEVFIRVEVRRTLSLDHIFPPFCILVRPSCRFYRFSRLFSHLSAHCPLLE